MKKALLPCLVIAASAVALSPGSAGAATAPQNCSVNSICGWSGTNFTGRMITFPVGAGCVNSAFPLRSIANTYPGGAGVPVAAAVYSGTNCSGTLVGNVQRGQSIPNLSPAGLSVYLTT